MEKERKNSLSYPIQIGERKSGLRERESWFAEWTAGWEQQWNERKGVKEFLSHVAELKDMQNLLSVKEASSTPQK